MYNDLEKAIYFATKAHKGQKRRNDDIDVIYHPYSVAMMLKDINLDNEYVITGLLHDIIEDSEYTYDDIKETFSETIADNILRVSEDNIIKDWIERKKEFISRLEQEQDINILYLECADKLHNLLSDYELFNKVGKRAWDSSPASYEENKWYYGEILKIINKKCSKNSLTIRYERLYNYYFGD